MAPALRCAGGRARRTTRLTPSLDVVIEIPRGSRNKYEYDHERHVIRLDRRLFSATVYPADYGFIPDTLAEDGDPLDALVLLEEPTFPGVLGARPADRRVLDGRREGPRRQDHLRPRPRPGVRGRHHARRAAPAPARRDRALLRRVQDARAGQGHRDPRLRGRRRGARGDRRVSRPLRGARRRTDRVRPGWARRRTPPTARRRRRRARAARRGCPARRSSRRR